MELSHYIKQDQTGLDRSARYTLEWTLNWAVLDCTDQRGRGKMSHTISRTFDGSSDDLKNRRGDLKSSMRTRDLFWSHLGLIGGAWGSQGVKGSI